MQISASTYASVKRPSRRDAMNIPVANANHIIAWSLGKALQVRKTRLAASPGNVSPSSGLANGRSLKGSPRARSRPKSSATKHATIVETTISRSRCADGPLRNQIHHRIVSGTRRNEYDPSTAMTIRSKPGEREVSSLANRRILLSKGFIRFLFRQVYVIIEISLSVRARSIRIISSPDCAQGYGRRSKMLCCIAVLKPATSLRFRLVHDKAGIVRLLYAGYRIIRVVLDHASAVIACLCECGLVRSGCHSAWVRRRTNTHPGRLAESDMHAGVPIASVSRPGTGVAMAPG